MDAFCWELESSERDTSNVARVDSSTNSQRHREKLFCGDYYLNILVYCQEYLIYHYHCSNHLVSYLEQRHNVGHMNSHNQMNSCHYCHYVNSYIQTNSCLCVNSYNQMNSHHCHVTVWIHTIRWFHVIIWIYTIRWIHSIMWIRTPYEFIHSMNSCNQMNSLHYVNSFITWIHELYEFIQSNEFTSLCEFIHSMNSRHYVNSYNQMNSRHYVNSYIIWIHSIIYELIHHMNSCSAGTSPL